MSSKKEKNISDTILLVKGIGYSASLLFILFGSYIFTLKDESKYIIPFVLCGFTFLFTITYYVITVTVVPIVVSDSQKNDNIKLKIIFSDVFGLVWVWLFWLIYGTIFMEISKLFGRPWVYIQTFILLSLVTVSYIGLIMKNKGIMWTIIIIYAIISVFFFSEDGISYNQTKVVIMVKVSLYYILYVINDYKLQIPDKVIQMIDFNITKKLNMIKPNKESKSDPENKDDDQVINYNQINYKEECLRMRFIGWMRCFWILSGSNYLIVLSLFQIVPIILFEYSSCIKHHGSPKIKKKATQVKGEEEEDNQFDVRGMLADMEENGIGFADINFNDEESEKVQKELAEINLSIAKQKNGNGSKNGKQKNGKKMTDEQYKSLVKKNLEMYQRK